MAADSSANEFELTRREMDDLFEREVLPTFVRGTDSPRKPIFASIGGQPGAGKSTLVNNLNTGFGNELTVRIDADKLADLLPRYSLARKENRAGWDDKPPETIQYLFDKLVSYAVDKGANIIFESCHAPRKHEEMLDNLKGYNKKIYIVATNSRVAFSAMYARAVDGYNKGLMGGCALVDREGYDRLYARWPRIAFEAEVTNPRFDGITIVNRDGKTLYENTVVARNIGGPAQWQKPFGAVDALMRESNRPLDQRERMNLRSTWKKVMNSIPFKQGHKEFPKEELISHEKDALVFLAETGPLHQRDIGDPFYDDAKKGKYYKRDAALVTRHVSEAWQYGRGFEQKFREIGFSHPSQDFHKSMHHETRVKATAEDQAKPFRSEGISPHSRSPSPPDSGYESNSPTRSTKLATLKREYHREREGRS